MEEVRAKQLDSDLKRQLIHIEQNIRENVAEIEKQQELLNLYNESLKMFSEEETGRTYVIDTFIEPVEDEIRKLNWKREELLAELKFKQGLRLILEDDLVEKQK